MSIRGIMQMASLFGLSLRGDFVAPPTPLNSIPLFNGTTRRTKGFPHCDLVLVDREKMIFTHVDRSKRYPYNSVKRGWSRA